MSGVIVFSWILGAISVLVTVIGIGFINKKFKE